MKTPRTLIEAIRYFTDAEVCRNYLAECRWPNGVSCPRKGCGSKDVWFIRTRAIWRCKSKSCRKQFSVKVGSIFEDSPIGLDKWLPAVWLLTCSTKGYSSHRLAKALGVTQKTAWFMLHRIRLALRAGSFETPMSGPVEGDTTGIGGKERNKHASKRLHRGTGNVGKAVVFGLLARHGQIRVKAVPNEQAATLQAEIRRNVESGAVIYTDEAAGFRGLSAEYAHEVINHSEEYVRGSVHTNSIESFWSNFKRTIYGTHHFVMPWQLDRYLDDAAFRFNQRKIGDGERFDLALAQSDGRRLTYKELTDKDV